MFIIFVVVVQSLFARTSTLSWECVKMSLSLSEAFSRA